MPGVVNCVKSSISENCTRAVFLDAYAKVYRAVEM
jgi:hypothetical protein